MTPSQTADLLSLAAGFDQRTIGTSDVLAWTAALEHLGFDDAQQAVVEHYRRSKDRVMPVDVIAGVRRIRTLRIQAAGDPPPDAHPDDVTAYRDALAAGRTAAADGDPKHRPVAAICAGQTIPRPDYADAPRKARELLRAAARQRATEDPAITAELSRRRAAARAEVDRARASTGDATPSGAIPSEENSDG